MVHHGVSINFVFLECQATFEFAKKTNAVSQTEPYYIVADDLIGKLNMQQKYHITTALLQSLETTLYIRDVINCQLVGQSSRVKSSRVKSIKMTNSDCRLDLTSVDSKSTLAI